ncbi:MAG TPA: hypothetical protein DHF18_05275, partial [Ruminococcaceae bacterium]|nr:hypothetical protein [Oscillospiraceae bacterium]
RRAFHKSRKGFISLKKALANASAFFMAGVEGLGLACRLARCFCTSCRGLHLRLAPLDTLRVQYSKRFIQTKSEIVRFARGEIIHFVNCDI